MRIDPLHRGRFRADLLACLTIACGTGATREMTVRELQLPTPRAQLINRSITLCVASALCVCLPIAALFPGALLGLGLVALLAVLCIISVLALVGSYPSFLREIFLATHSRRFGGPQLQ